MRILRIYPFLPPLPGGMEKHIRLLTKEQRRLGCEVIVSFNQGQATAPDDIHVLPSFNLRRVKPQALRDLIFYFFLFIKVAVQGLRFDVVHVHGDWSAFLFGRMVACISRSKKLVGSLHGVAGCGIWSGLYRFVLKGYTLVYATGARDALYFGSLTESPVRWQHSGIDAVFFGPVEERKRSFDVVTVGSFVPIKNFALIVDIALAMPHLRFLLIGDGPQKGVIEADCLRRGISNITFAGQLPSVKVAKQLRDARIFLLTSFAEGTPTALLEAMACGLAVVTSRSNDYEDLIKPGQNGYVVEGFQGESYVRRIRELLDDENLLREISHRNSEQAIRYGWPEVAKRITEWMRA